ncbi:fumarate reductase/succinate dehydrogenase flavoprotein domain protein [Alkaliphilus metalliredigens QYMF]|uniref:Urocanate reductase n=1 Tax=Alkaliphilus metalliredigens (strain QYMF) TaxID=293826 RepID=A6TN26_ALKMQ|nr:FAD-dependent oxidoreductase [Alkaliphilus metalliredigens]ABR47594.1 fumarate reductase/succinate dehydrogenase flavoprotein domain protein [Alkaliphilus metalliredigens QYMF]
MNKKLLVSLLVLLLVFSLIGCSSTDVSQQDNENAFNAGAYTAEAEGMNGPIKVEVTVSDTSIIGITVLESSETVNLGDLAMESLIEDVIKNQSIGIDSVSGATITSEAFLLAVESALLEAGGDLDLLKTAVAKENEGAIVELDADVVVIGAGGSGTAAAVTAAENGAKVIVLEKAAIAGGTTAMGGGFFAADSAQARSLGHEPVDTGYIFEKWMDEMDWLADATLVKQFLELSHTTADWMEGHGIEFEKTKAAVQQSHAEGTNGYHKYNDHTKTSSQLTAMLDKIVADYDASIYYETPATSLITENNEVTGVIASAKDGSTLHISAKSVIVATGGFVGNSDMVTEALNGVSVNASGYNSNVGDGINMAVDAGAAKRGLSAMVTHTFAVDGGNSVEGDYEFMELYQATNSVAYMPIIPWVNASGVRFANEDIVYDRALSGNAVMSQGNYAHFIYNEELLNILETEGARAAGMLDKIAMGPMPEITPMDFGWSKLTEIVGQMVDAGHVVKADTIEELAEKLNMNPDALVETMKKYNADAAEGMDTLYGKDGSHMYAMTEGPYYAFKVTVNNLGTVGGIRINSNFEVVMDEPEKGYSTIVTNLYAAGSDAAGLYSDHYAHAIEGAAQGWAYNSGRLAGARAAENALDIKINLFDK